MTDTPILEDDTQPNPVVTDEMEAPAGPPSQMRAASGGCLLPAMGAGFLASVLVVVGLFLPPVNLYDRLFGVQYAMLSAESNAVAASGLTLVADPEDVGDQFGVRLEPVAMNDFLAGNSSAGAWVPVAAAAAPAYLALQSPVYSIETTGSAPETVTLSMALPQGVGNTDVLDLYEWDAAAGSWRFVPSHPTGAAAITATMEKVPSQVALFQALPLQQPTVVVAVDVVQTLLPDAAQLATVVAPGGLQPTLEGTLTGSLAPGFDQNAGYLVMPVIRNFTDPRALDPETVTAILSNRTLRSQHVANILAFASGGFDGVIIDYRDLPVEQGDNFAAFMHELDSTLSNAGLRLGVVVPAAQNVSGAWNTGAYAWRELGQAVDLMQVDLSLDPATFAPGEDRLVEAMLRWAVGEVSRYKLVLGISAQSVRQASGDFTTIGYDEALSALGDVSVDAETTEAGTVLPGTEIAARLDGFRAESGFDQTVQSPYVEYLDESDAPVARMWLTTGEALRFRMDRTALFALGGVAFEDLMADDIAEGVLQTILDYKIQLPSAPAMEELALHWRIEGSNGVLGEVTTNLNEELRVTLEASDGNYAINVAVVGAGEESPRSGVAVALYAPTATPTPVPTATPTPTPTPRPAAPSGPVSQPGTGPIAQPGAGSIAVGSFEYGGHVTSPDSQRAIGAMRSAGMTWMKVQIRYTLGMDPSVAAGAINAAHASGFKILLGIPGVPGELAAGGAGYMQQYAQFLGGVASYGPDAIEVWNEMNIDREWPTGQISGAAYAEMLRLAYQAIKSANGSVMVVSGALAPTGAEAAYPGRVVNDDRFIREMVAAGAMQYMDCLGAHYNEGIVAPGQTSGDPRGDDYYTRFFWGMVNVYWGESGGQRPICFTELGFLTPEGYPPLDPFFGWGATTSVAEQAAWLAEAAALASQSGKVRLMIVWNVDFQTYGADPQAGYAMVRADGSCPACQSLAGAR